MSGSIGRLSATALIVGCALCGASIGYAQQKQKVLLPSVSGKYIQQHAIDVGDVPGHQVRIYEVLRAYGADGPSIDGVHLKESWSRGFSDYIELNGPSSLYIVFVMENGDKVYARGSLTANSVPSADGKYALKTMQMQTITGGTGKFIGIRGIVRTESLANPAAGVNQNKGEIEYWMEK